MSGRPLVSKTDYPNVPIESAIVDAIILSMSNQISPRVELICGAKRYIIDGHAIMEQIKSAGIPI
mgnify:CR=1 FL=1